MGEEGAEAAQTEMHFELFPTRTLSLCLVEGVANAAELREEVMKQKFEASFGGRARSGEGEKKTGSAEGGGHAAGGGAVEALPGGLPGRPDGAHGHRAPGVGAQARAPGGARVGDGAMCVFVCVCVCARVCACACVCN
jgi:hypothetical protein